MEVSPLRQKVGRTVLGLFGAAGVALGAFGAFGIHSAGPRFLAVLSGVGLISHSVAASHRSQEGGAKRARF